MRNGGAPAAGRQGVFPWTAKAHGAVGHAAERGCPWHASAAGARKRQGEKLGTRRAGWTRSSVLGHSELQFLQMRMARF